MSTFNTEFRTKFEMENDIGEQFDMLERRAQDAFISIFASDVDPFENDNRVSGVRWSKHYD
jgi:hypothetical protein